MSILRPNGNIRLNGVRSGRSNVRMVDERAKTGAKAPSDWLRRCRATVGEVKGATFVRLLEMLVESVLLYGVEAWGCGGQLNSV